MSTKTVQFVANIPNAIGKVGIGYIPQNEMERSEIGAALGNYLRPITEAGWQRAENGLLLPIACMDERPKIDVGLGEGHVDDPERLAAMDTYQLAGGGVLATAKAIVAANVAAFRDVNKFTTLIEQVQNTFDQTGIVNMPHEGCGASGHVTTSIEYQLSPEEMGETLQTIAGIQDPFLVASLAGMNHEKAKKLDSAFFEGYTPEWYDGFMRHRNPATYAVLRTEHDAVHGHHGSSVVSIPDGYVLDEAGYFNDTGRMSFGLTFGILPNLVRTFGLSQEEQRLLTLGYLDDTVNVSRQIVTGGMPLYS